MSDTPSPRNLEGVGPTSNDVTMGTPYSDVRSSRSAIKTELVDRLVFDDYRVFERLGISHISDSLVDACAASFMSANEVAINTLRELIADAEGRDVDDLEAEYIVDKKKVKRREVKMYPHLESIFKYITTFDAIASPQEYGRRFISASSKYLTVEPHTWAFPICSPDFSLINADVNSQLWRERVAFAEIKPSSKQGPKPANPGGILSIVTQCGDYARLHMSARPFQIFSVGLLIFGSKFCVGIFDRGGITFSPIHDMWGLDKIPVTALPDGSVELKAAQALATQLLPDAPISLSFSISVGGNSHRRWYTLGPPIWNSLSFLGRGTTIWRVTEVKDGQLTGLVVVMKSAWRSSKRLGESDIYQFVMGGHPGVAKLEFGDDVRTPVGDAVTVNALRLHPLADELETPTLHRLFLKTLGRPIWEYSSEIELLKGLCAALRGHAFLCGIGILHRDISAGNILLSATCDAKPGHEGFLTDLEFVYVTPSSFQVTKTVITAVPPIRQPFGLYTEPTMRSHTTFGTVRVERGATMSGTVQFMATELLEGEVFGYSVTHQAHHDIESFIWVMCYSICRQHYPSTPDKEDKLLSYFHNNFGRVDMKVIHASRAGSLPLLLYHLSPGLLPLPMVDLCKSLRTHVRIHQVDSSPKPLTHETLLAEFEQVIGSLEMR